MLAGWRVAISTYRYESQREPRTALRLRIREIAAARGRYGDRKIQVLLKHEGWKVGKKLVYRLYREEGLTLLYKQLRRRRSMVTLFLDARPNMCYHLLPVRRDFFLAFWAIGQGKIGGVL